MSREIIQSSLDYIEDNLKTEITAEELRRQAGFSLFHYYRLFQSATGMPVMQYITRRRLLHAVYEISLGEKMIDVALEFGFDTHAGFYKAFQREFGYTPSQYLKRYKVKKPYRINLLKEEHVMITHKKLEEVLKQWGLEAEPLTDIIYEETGNRNESACYVGNDYVIKFSANLGKVENSIAIAKALREVGLTAATAVATPDGKEYISEGELFFYVTKRIRGAQLKAGTMYLEDYEKRARFIGEVIGQLSLALKKVEVPAKDVDILSSACDWAIPELKGKLDVPEAFTGKYVDEFSRLYPQLPKQLIHRDPNPGNIILSEDSWGFIDFELSERNVRIFDPCYAATAILSESFVGADEEKLCRWIEVYKNILYGYDSVVKLTEEEKEAVPYVILSNQLMATAWFATQEKYQELYGINKRMTEWMVGHLDEMKLDSPRNET